MKIGLIKFPPPSPPSRPKLCSNGPPKSWIDDPFFCKIQNQGRSSEPLPRESKLFTFKHVHFQDEALAFHRKDFTLPVQNFIPARQSSNCPIPFPPRHVRQSNAREDVEALNWSAHNWLLSKPLISTVFFSRSDSVSTNYVYNCLFSFFFRSIQVTMLFKFALITMLATAFISEASANSCPRWVKLNKSPVCFGARDSQFGAFAYSQNILVSSFMLVHLSGTVTCNKRHYSYWGCYPNHASINVVLTDHQNKLLAPAATNHGGWYNLSGYTSSSSALVFCAAKKPHCIHANTQLRLWYGEDLRGYTESDNGGKTCADVYGLLV